MQWKHTSNYCLQQCTLFVLERILFCFDWTPATVSLWPVCVHYCHCIPNCVYVLKCRNAMWLYRQYNVRATSQIVWYNSKWGRIQRKENVCTVCVSVCRCLSETVCSYFLYVVALFWYVVVSCIICDRRLQVIWGVAVAAAQRVF